MSSATEPHLDVKPEELTPVEPLTTWRMFLLSVVAALIVFVIGAAVDMVVLHEHDSRLTASEVSDVLGGCIAGALIFRLLQYERERRARLRQKLIVIADMNHHVRNALQVISLHTYSSADQQQIEAVRESMRRIQWALKEILPKL